MTTRGSHEMGFCGRSQNPLASPQRVKEITFKLLATSKNGTV